MLRRLIAAIAATVTVACMAATPERGQDSPLSFGVITQRSPVLTAQYWNPILRYVSERSGVPLRLKLAKTGSEHSDMIGRGEFDFIYSNHNFNSKNDAVGYRVIARPIEAAIMGQIVVPAESPIHTLAELAGKEVVFPSKAAFVGYYVPMDALLQAGVYVKPLFAGNQEGAMGQLKSGRVPAASVNSQIMRDYAERERYAYRVLWSSEPYLNIPISAHPSVPAAQVKAVQEALIGMSADPGGARILAASAQLIKQQPPFGFMAANDKDFNNIRQFFRKTLVKD
jgi:phosphonate transport system substrate-binding protein